MLDLRGISLRRGTKLLLDGADLRLHPGQKLGLIGANGCGKSSLLALLRGELAPDAGTLSIPNGWEIAHVAQHTPSGGREAIEFVIDGDRELRALQSALAAAEADDDGIRQGELLGQLDAIGAWEAESRAAQLMHGLGFAVGDERQALDTWSGGWRMRLALAQALMCRSDLLLLDEPTNHLDLDAVIWLEGWLRSYPGTLVLISHDRDVLDAVVTSICHLERGRLQTYSGGYSAFERQRSEQLAQQQAAYQRQQREIAHMQAFVDRFRAKATKARQAQSRLKALERLELIAPAHVDTPFRFRFRDPESQPHPLLQLEAVSVGYDSTAVLENVGLALAPGDRLALLGANGAGKSTLIKTLAGEQPLLCGARQEAQGLRIGYFAQHQMDQLRPDASPLQHLIALDREAPEQSLRDFLGGFGFSGDQATEPVAPFSGGEKARLALALIVYQRPNLLLLDEPTNHLDLEMRHALSTALQEFVGAMVLVSHDRHLLRITCDDLLLVDAGRVVPFDGDLDDYPNWISQRAAQRRTAANGTSAAQAGADAGAERPGTKKAARQRDAEERARSQPLRRRLAELEQRLERLTEQRDVIDQRLSDSKLYEPEAKQELLAVMEDKRKLSSELNEIEQAWLAAGEALEQLQSQQR
ncbi:ATP-binding cassette domain-containing protein [Halochromatium glycolicum]|uniref:Probable ATP-binding protein YheS n=1 Tax=Halochromatium glycolicum TaxID=85075 RepID=A0AAJ0U4A2_9GAMM|nr:ATP-binding cassette domain-containing protein [Halochromatium glycolicum]MBK1704848.1 ABC transporter ATP-binding protein [Halochromatium glycolicum]